MGIEDEDKPLPSTSGTSPSERPVQKSATRFKRMMEEGLLSPVEDSQSASSDNEYDTIIIKQRRTTSTTSSRRRLNSDSDPFSVGKDDKYRERRDRNNLSSKRSRQKKKMLLQMKQKELKELEHKNAKLRFKAEELESLLTQVKAMWADHLGRATIKTEAMNTDKVIVMYS